ncbi:MAG TPA: NADH-quinone oxidoreductase subunit L [Actinomycetota bacterium]|jgi:NADH-quinone oxidoreductase subunit L|nr:NADH-quinone oxidoreductase subunit L [Actinomycetota bacterium]
MREMAWLIPVLPLSAFFLIVFFGKRTPGKGAPIGITATGIAFAIGLLSFVEAINSHEIVERSIRWITFGSLSLELGIRVDSLAAMMFVVVCLVSLLVQIYSLGYMHGDVRYTWYYAALNLFTGSMLTLVIANNTVQLLLGWELVGICSYLLIGHWYEEKENSDAAIKAFITTKTGDLGFVIGIFVLFIGAHTFNIGQLQERVAAGDVSSTVVTAGALLLFCGAVGKSAQFPLHVWLPDAMAGPTPVSALIHAATMVTAGVYMVARIFGLFSASETAMSVIAVVASITMLLAAVLAVVQRDIKRVLAYSTVSQLGYMMAALSVGAATAGIFHLWTHAFFKALLFLGAGSVIHAVHSNDMFEMGGLRRFMPVTYATFIIGSLALAGVPPFAGFWSKDEIVAASFESGNRFVFVAALITAFLTAFYMARACTLTFFGRYRRMPIAGGADDDHAGHASPHESPPSMTGPLIVLGVLSVVGGWVGTPVNNLFAEWFHFEGAHHGEFVGWIAVLSIIIALAGIGLGVAMYRNAEFGFGVLEPLKKLGPLFRAAERRFYFDDVYLGLFVRPVQYPLAKFVYRRLDQKLIDGVVNAAGSGTVLTGRATRSVDEHAVDGVVNGAAWLTDKLSFGLRRTQTGNVQRYAAGLFAGLVIVGAVLFITGGIG